MALIRFGVEVDQPLASFLTRTGLNGSEIHHLMVDSPSLCRKSCVTKDDSGDVIDLRRVEMYLETLENAVNRHAERWLACRGSDVRDPQIRVVCCFVQDPDLAKALRGDGTLQFKFYRYDQQELEPSARVLGNLGRTETYH